MIHKHCATLCAIIRSHSFILLPLRLRIILYRPSLLSEQPVGVLFSFSLRENKNLKDIRSKKKMKMTGHYMWQGCILSLAPNLLSRHVFSCCRILGNNSWEPSLHVTYARALVVCELFRRFLAPRLDSDHCGFVHNVKNLVPLVSPFKCVYNYGCIYMSLF